MSEYTNNKNIYFLNDKNISQTLGGDQQSDINPIPSLKLLNKVNDDIILSIETLCSEISGTVDDRIEQKSCELSDSLSSYSNSLCISINSKIDSLCSQISAKIDSNFEALDSKINTQVLSLSGSVNNEFVHLSGNNKMANDLSVDNSIIAGNAIIGKELDINDNFTDTTGIRVRISDPDGVKITSRTNPVDLKLKDGAKDVKINDTDLCSLIKNAVDYGDSSVLNTLNTISNALSDDYVKKINFIENQISNDVSSNYALKENVYTKEDVNSISSDLSIAVKNAGYTVVDSFDFKYIDHSIVLSVNDFIGKPSLLSINTAKFEEGRILKAVHVKDNILWLEFILEDGTGKDVSIDFKDISQVYKAGTGISIDNDLNISVTDYVAKQEFAQKINDNLLELSHHVSSDSQLNDQFLKYYTKEQNDSIVSNYTLTSDFNTISTHIDDIQKYVDSLSSYNPDNYGIIPTLSDAIKVLNNKSIHEIKFLGHMNIVNVTAVSSIIDLLKSCSLVEPGYVQNGSIFNVAMPNDKISVEYVTSDGIYLHNGDWIIVHKHNDIDKINVETIIQSDVYIIKGDVSRTEFEIEKQIRAYNDEVLSNALTSEVSARISSDEVLSNAISSKIFVYDPNFSELSGYGNLSVIKINKDEYDKMVVDHPEKLSGNVLWVISSDYMDAYGQVLSNLTMTNDITPSEAATKHYVDDKYDKLKAKLSSIYHKFDTIDANSDLSDLLCIIVDIKNTFGTL